MACNKCNNSKPCNCNCDCDDCGNTHIQTHICDPCTNPQPPCEGCPVKDLSTDCVLYDQDDIKCGEVVVVPKNTPLTEVLRKIVAWACTKFSEVQNYFVVKNVGNGAGVYKGTNLIGEKELKSLTSTNGSVTITSEANTIDFSVGTPCIESTDNTVQVTEYADNCLDLSVCIGSEDNTVNITTDNGCFDLSVPKVCVVSTKGTINVNTSPEGCIDLDVNFPQPCIRGGENVVVEEVDNCLIVSTTLDGSETKVQAGTNVTVTGTGTASNPYIINSQIPLAQQWQRYDIKEVDLPDATAAAYIAANFDSTGLGTNSRLGWAICNGNNGTKNRMGRTSIGYDPVNYPINTVPFGQKDVALDVTEMPPHAHSSFLTKTEGPPSQIYEGNNIEEGNDRGLYWTLAPTTITGGLNGITKPHNNMQPSIVTLIIQKI